MTRSYEADTLAMQTLKGAVLVICGESIEEFYDGAFIVIVACQCILTVDLKAEINCA